MVVAGFLCKRHILYLKSTSWYTSTHVYTQSIMARTSEPKRMQLCKESQYLGLNFSSFTVYLDIPHEITVTIQNICHLFIMSIWEIWQYHSIVFFKQDPNKLTETQNKDGYKYSFLTFTFGIKSDITLMCVCEKLVTKWHMCSRYVSVQSHDSMHTKCEELTHFYPHNFNNFSEDTRSCTKHGGGTTKKQYIQLCDGYPI
jgi:hypothetical protein